MNRKVLLLLIFCIGITVVGVIVIYEFFPHIFAIETSIGEINSNPSAWVNKMVVVEGKLCGPMVFIPEAMPPWNYKLFGSNETIETIGEKETVNIGVLWNGKGDYNMENTRVVGVVREGRWVYLYGERPVCYYIEAKRIDRL
jgi:hypothetical protein